MSTSANVASIAEEEPLPLECKIFDISQTRRGNSPRSAGEPNWNTFLRMLAEEDPDDRVVDGIYFEPHEVGPNLVLGVYKPVNMKFMTRLNEKGSAVDLELDQSGPLRLAHASCVLFSNSTSSIGVLKGHRQAPGAAEVERLLRDRFLLDGKWSWSIQPIVQAAQIDALRKAKGVFGFRTRLVPAPEALFSMGSDDKYKLSDMHRKISSAVGAEVDMDLGIKVARGFRSQDVGRKLRDYILSDIDETVGISKVGSADILSHDNIRETVNLARHNMAIHVEIAQRQDDSIRFSQLVEAIERNRVLIEEQGHPNK